MSETSVLTSCDMVSGPDDLECIGLRDETPSVRTFRLRRPAGLAVEPGQALQIRVPLPDAPAWRSFTISGSDDEVLELTIKAQAPGGATRWLHDHFTPGQTIRARSPRGHFTLGLRSREKLAFVSGGAGATPMRAMLAALAATDPGADVVWFHAARNPDEILFARELEAFQESMPNLRVLMMVGSPRPGWFGLTGRIGRGIIAATIPDFGRREVFCCGPAGFMTTTQLIHAAEGGDKSFFHTETFAPAPAPAAPVLTEAAPGSPAFRMRIGGRDLEIRTTESILQAALRQGVIISSGCGEGMCGTCMVRLHEGEVATTPQGGISAQEEAQGYVLACSTRAVSDLVVSLD